MWNIIIDWIFSETEPEEMLDGAESQNYGYGYGTKVRDDASDVL